MNKDTDKEQTILEGKVTKVEVVKENKTGSEKAEKKSKEIDTKIYGDVILLTMLEIMGVEKFRVALAQALERHAGDSHLRTERTQAKEFFNVVSDLKYLGWKTDDFKM